MRISQPELFAEVAALAHVQIDTARTPSESLSKADILLSDISGIAHECAFVFQRPVLVVDQEQKMGGLEGELLGGDSELKQICKEFIIPIPPSEMRNIVDHVDNALKHHSAAKIEQIREGLIYNFGQGAETAAEQIELIYRRRLESVATEKSSA
jgi:hypothetical protein